MSSVPFAKVIVNPAAGGYSGRTKWPRISQLLCKVGLSFDYEFTNESGHAMAISREACEKGYGCVVAVGGDGTVNEVVNGILTSTNPRSTALGVISTGTACNFARSLGIPQDNASACLLLTGQSRVVVDVGLVTFQNQNKTSQRYFVGAADVGMGSAVVDIWNRQPSPFGSHLNHLLRLTEALIHFFQHRNKLMKIQIGPEVVTDYSFDVVIANQPYFADGMKIAPRATLNDGLLDMVTFGDISKYELLKMWPKLYHGGHIGYPKIEERQIESVTIDCQDKLLVEADGLILGETPASFQVIPAALTVVLADGSFA